ncbi:MAG: hypothetical protein J6Y91_01385 [Alphaproteobacteria bacterium]|nr:hypothetical protein [Alphaproteobacteria bacterium]
MSYSLKNKTVVVIAVAFALMVVTSRLGYAQATPAGDTNVEAQVPTTNSEDMELFGLDDSQETAAKSETEAKPDAKPDAQPEADAAAKADDLFGMDDTAATDNKPADADKATDEAPKDAAGEKSDQKADQAPVTTDDVYKPIPEDDFLGSSAEDDEFLAMQEKATAARPKVTVPNPLDPGSGFASDANDAIPAADAPKSPFENFGNAILSKVDNDLFNQMSNIEKQTTILNLQIKREELQNRVEALKAARIRAREEEEERRRELAEKRKDREAERQAKLLAEQEKLRQREIELEKVRQARVLNEYMNEMLLVNQKWVDENAVLINRISELEKERIELIKDFEKKSNTVRREIASVKKRAEGAAYNHERIVTSLNAQITQLRKSVIENEDRYKKLKEGGSDNPFASMPQTGLSGIDENAIDMSKEYAIMDITGKGNNVVAKIVNSEGTTFIVHKGSMLKGGEVVTAITDNYIAFDNKGIKSYLYTGGSVMEFEPTVSFNDSDKMPEETEKNSIKSEVRNVLGQGATLKKDEKTSNDNNRTAPQPTAKAKEPKTSSSTVKRGSISASSGMFMK